MGCHVAILNKLVSRGLIKKVAVEQGFEGGEEVSWADVWEIGRFHSSQSDQTLQNPWSGGA